MAISSVLTGPLTGEDVARRGTAFNSPADKVTADASVDAAEEINAEAALDLLAATSESNTFMAGSTTEIGDENEAEAEDEAAAALPSMLARSFLSIRRYC